MAIKKAKQSLERSTAVSRTEQKRAASFISHYPEIEEYLDIFSKDKKYLLLQGGTVELQEKIFNYVLEKILSLVSPDESPHRSRGGIEYDPATYPLPPQYSCLFKSDISSSYDYCSYSVIDCLNTNDNKIFDTIYDSTDDDLKHIQLILSKFLYLVIAVKQVDPRNDLDINLVVGDENIRYNFDLALTLERILQRFSSETLSGTGGPYEIREGSNIKTGSFTGTGLKTIIQIVNDMLESKPKISEKRLLSVLIEEFLEDYFAKLRIVKLLNVSRENKFGLGTKETRPDFVFATLKEGESIEGLMPMFRNGKLFEFVSLDGEKPRDQECIEEATDRGANQQCGTVKFTTPPNSVWSDVEILFTDNEHVKFIIKGKEIPGEIKFTQIGFADTRRKESKPDRAWNRLKLFAYSGGVITDEFNESIKNTQNKELIKSYYVNSKDIQSINLKLCDIFKPIPGKPIPRHSREGECYKTNLKSIKLADNVKRHLKSEMAHSIKKDADVSDDSFFQDARDNNYSSRSCSSLIEDDPQRNNND
jgi:hypothetical protein